MEFSRMDVFIMGPGLGRNPTLLNQIEQWMTLCKEWKIPIVVDGDALYLVAKKPTVIYGNEMVVLTPNAMEYARLCHAVELIDTVNVMESLTIPVSQLSEK